jgi:dTDP-4-dehydrorhamnose 3,5-epimerase-like enzyme
MIRMVDLPTFGEQLGFLVPLEQNSTCVPFELNRIYYIFGADESVRRGFHAHKKLKQLLVCVSGACTIELDDGSHRKAIRLNSPSKGVLIETPLWREISDFTRDCVLVVLASEPYDACDYIWDYGEFCRFVKG